jgi:hypothetical protein
MSEIAYWSAIYLVMMFIQFKALRRLSQRKTMGMALGNQEQQRKVFVKSILWILAFIFSLVSI